MAPDIAVISECPHPNRFVSSDINILSPSVIWAGPPRGSRRHGVAVIAFGDFSVTAHPAFDPEGLNGLIRYAVPVRAIGNGIQINVIGIWAQNDADYVGPSLAAVRRYRNELATGRAVFAGDLNQNVRWDRKRRWPNHSDTVAELCRLSLVSAYHHVRAVEQGAEPEPTHWHRRKLADAYHTEYVFVPALWAEHASVTVGGYDEWVQLSDHAPLVVELPVDILRQ